MRRSVIAVGLALFVLLVLASRAGAAAPAQTATTLVTQPAAAANVYIADSANNRVVKVAPSGTQTTVATGLGSPFGVAVDGAGNVYIADTNDGQVLKVAPGGAQTTVGSGFVAPFSVAVDEAGDVYVADPFVGQVQKVAPDGTQTMVASGLSFPAGVAVDAAGDVYIVETGASEVLKIAPDGTQSTTGTGLNQPAAAAVDGAGNVYIADTLNNRVVEVRPGGAQYTLVGGLSGPNGVAVDAAGSVYVSDTGNNRVLQIHPGGAKTTVATGLGSPDNVAVDAPAAATYFGGPVTLTATVLAAPNIASIPTGQVSFSDGSSSLGTATLGLYGMATLTVTNLPVGVDELTASYAGDTSNASSTSPPVGVIVTKAITGTALTTAPAPAPDVYIADTLNHRVVKVAPDGAPTTVLTGVTPVAVAVDPAGNLYVSDGDTESVIKVTPGGVRTTVVSTQPLVDGLAVDSHGDLFVAEPATGTVLEVSPTGARTSITGLGTPYYVAVDSAGDLYCYTGGDLGLLKRTPDGAVSVVLGFDQNSASAEGVAVDGAGNAYVSSASFPPGMLKVAPDGTVTAFGAGVGIAAGVAVDSAGNVYAADYANNRVVRIAPDGTQSTIGAGLNDPQGVAIDSPAAHTSYGDRVTLTANVLAPPNSGRAPTGQVTFKSRATVLGTAPVNSSGAAILKTATIPFGTQRVTATYGGDGNDIGSSSQPATIIVAKGRTGVNLTAAPRSPPDVFVTPNGGPVVDVAPNGTQTTVGTGLAGPGDLATDSAGNLYIVDTGAGSLIRVAPNGTQSTAATGFLQPQGVAVDNARNLYVADTDNRRIVKIAPSGAQTIVASGLDYPRDLAVDAAGDLYFSTDGPTGYELAPDGTRTALPVFAPWGVAVDGVGNLYLSDPGAAFYVWQVPPGGTPATVCCTNFNATDLAVDAGGAVYIPDQFAQDVLKVAPDGTQTTVLSGPVLPLGVATYTPPTQVRYSATVTLTATVLIAPNNGVIATGQVTFTDGTVTVGTVPVDSSGAATLITSALAAGAQHIVAHFSGDANTRSSVSSSATVVVSKASTKTTLTSSANPSIVGPVTYTASVSPVAPSTGQPTGTLAFFDGSSTTPIAGCGSVALTSSGHASCQTSYSAGGAHSITARYSGDTNFTASTSSALTQQVSYAVKLLYSTTATHTSGTKVPITLQLQDASASNVSSSSVTVTALCVVAQGATNCSSLVASINAPFNFLTPASGPEYQYRVATKGFANGSYSLLFTAGGDPITHAAPFVIG
jgi:sugar lactone lactonase YvrE